jgi:phosphonatase-like hydrolase
MTQHQRQHSFCSAVALRPRLAVLDLIGTTIQAGPEVAGAFREAFARAGITLTDEAIDRVRGRSKEQAVIELTETCLPSGPTAAVARTIYATFQSLLRSSYEATSCAVPGTGAALAALARRGVDVVLTTGLDRTTAEVVVRCLGSERALVRGVLTGDDVERGRPAPDLIHAAMALAGTNEPASVLVVGDTIPDLEAAAHANAGWIVGVLSGAHSRGQLETCRHSVLLESVAELPDWLERVAALG